jgi:hypothetical protein
MMGQPEGRAEAISGEFNSQNVANTLWAFATMGHMKLAASVMFAALVSDRQHTQHTTYVTSQEGLGTELLCAF